MLIPACDSSSLAFCMMYHACKLNQQDDNIQPCCTPFPILNYSLVPCPVLAVGFWLAYMFLRRQVRWSGIPIFLRIFKCVVIYIVKGFSVVNEADVFMEFSCFFYDPKDVHNLISGSSAFSKPCMYIWKFSVHELLQPTLKDFEHYPADVKWAQLCSSLNILCHFPSLGSE